MAVTALEREAGVHEVRSQLTVKNDLVHRHALRTEYREMGSGGATGFTVEASGS